MDYNNNDNNNNNNKSNRDNDIRTIELKVINEKFSLDTQYAITSLIKDSEYRQFISQLNEILNDNRLLYVSFFLFIISFLFFGLFMNLSILFGWLLLVKFILLSVYFFYRYQKYNSYSRYMLMQEQLNNINKKKSIEGVPINFCLLLRKKEEINFYSGVSVDISLIVSYSDYEVYQPPPPQVHIPSTSNNVDSYFVNDSSFGIPLDINNKHQINNNENNNHYSTIQLSDGYTTEV